MALAITETSADQLEGASGEIKYHFDCVLDGPSLIAVLHNADKGDTMLERWLCAESLQVRIPQHVLSSLKGRKTESSQRTLIGLDRVTNHFSNVKFEQSFESFQTPKELLDSPKPPIHWHEFVAKRSVANDEIAALSASLGNALQIDMLGDTLLKMDSAGADILDDSAPMAEKQSAKILAPIGTGRPGRTRLASPEVPPAKPVVVESPATHPIFRYMWYNMCKQHEDGLKHIWILVSTDPLLEQGAKELGIPCMSQESLHNVLLAEFSQIDQPSSPRSTDSNGIHQYTFPSTATSPSPYQSKPLALDALYLGPYNIATPVPMDQNLIQEVRFADRSAIGNRPESSVHLVPTEPRNMRQFGSQAMLGQAHHNGIMMVDPNSFNRSPAMDNNNKSNRGGRNDVKFGHRYRNSSQFAPPSNAPTGPRSMSGSSGKSRPNVKQLSPTVSPTIKSNHMGDKSAAQAVASKSPRPVQRAAKGEPSHGYRPASQGANSPVPPSSPRVGNDSPKVTPNSNRGHRPPRHIPYVPPKAREQQAQQQANALAPAANIDLTKPIDPESFGRGQLIAGTIKSQPAINNIASKSRGHGARGGSMRGRGQRGSMRGRGVSIGDRKLFDPS